jgi:hypothetical protein
LKNSLSGLQFIWFAIAAFVCYHQLSRNRANRYEAATNPRIAG